MIKINEMVEIEGHFKFTLATGDDVENVVKGLDISKATNRNIPTKVTNIYNNGVIDSAFPSNMKCADVNPVRKKDDLTDVRNYRPISILPVPSKVFERR